MRVERAYVHRAVLFLIPLICLPAGGAGATVSGMIVVSKKLSRKTPAPVPYDLRGISASEQPAGSEPANQFEKVAVWLEPAVPVPVAPHTATMQQRNRRFEPGLLIVPVGSTIEFPNADPIFHNVFSLSRAQPFDLGYYADGRSKSVRFTRAGIVQVYCHVHPSMYGVVVVTTTPWAGKPSGDGAYSWTDVPAGHYDLMVWQRVVGLIRKKVVVPETGIVRIDFQIPADEAEK
jgi:plastocyanin